MYYSYFTQKNCVKYVPHVAIFIWFILMFTQGDRRFIIYSLMIILGIAESFYRKQIKLNMRFLFTIFSIYILFAFIANVRWIFPFLLRDQMSLKDAMNWIVEHISFEWILPAKNEFAGLFYCFSLKYQEKIMEFQFESLIHWPKSLSWKNRAIAKFPYKFISSSREVSLDGGYSQC